MNALTQSWRRAPGRVKSLSVGFFRGGIKRCVCRNNPERLDVPLGRGSIRSVRPGTAVSNRQGHDRFERLRVGRDDRDLTRLIEKPAMTETVEEMIARGNDQRIGLAEVIPRRASSNSRLGVSR